MELVASLIISALMLVIGLVVAYFIIKSAIINGQRHARREQYVEDYLPEQASWLSSRQREELKEHSARLGRI